MASKQIGDLVKLKYKKLNSGISKTNILKNFRFQSFYKKMIGLQRSFDSGFESALVWRLIR